MAQNTYSVANLANQALSQAQQELKTLTEGFAQDFKNSIMPETKHESPEKE